MQYNRFHYDNIFSNTPQIYGAIHFMQIGDIYFETDHIIDSHTQIYHELCCVVAGTGIFSRNGKTFSVKEGDILISPIGSEHMIISDPKNPLRIFYCAFVFDPEHPEFHVYSEFEKFLYDDLSPVISDKFRIANVFTFLFNEVQNEHQNKSTILKLELELLFLLTQRCFDEKPTTTFHYSKDKNSKNQLVYDIIQYIDNHLFHITKLPDIADALGYSYSYITQSFSSVMQESLISYYRRQRLKKAADLLSQGFTVTAITNMLKFDSIQSFSRSFKSYFGVSPSNYSKKQRN